jgi:Ser/Thr protein kinase RdoA (MazF antagonist)
MRIYNAKVPSPPYSTLTPDVALDALASFGLRPDGRLLSLNSYENRVYQAWMEEGPPFVAKFYRPARWDDPAFPAAFPWFGTQRYWQDRILELREQIAAMDEPPLAIP